MGARRALPPSAAILFLGQRTFELAVTVERDSGCAFLDRADDVHHVAAADLRCRLDATVLIERGLEIPLRPTLLLEGALHVLPVHGDVDGHLVGVALRIARDIRPKASPSVDDGLRLGSTGDEKNREGS